METLLITLVLGLVIYEVFEHLVVPGIGFLFHRKKKTSYGPDRFLGETGKVKGWRDREGYVFVAGELWKAASDCPLEIGSQVVIQKREGLVLTVVPKEQGTGPAKR